MISTELTSSASNLERVLGSLRNVALIGVAVAGLWLVPDWPWARVFHAESSAGSHGRSGAGSAALRGQRPAGPAQAAQAVFGRCTQAMVQGTCGVMRSTALAIESAGKPTSEAQTRVFVAGAGEVDAAAYARLLRQGDAMCAEVAQACEQAWTGSACRMARALYPADR